MCRSGTSRNDDKAIPGGNWIAVGCQSGEGVPELVKVCNPQDAGRPRGDYLSRGGSRNERISFCVFARSISAAAADEDASQALVTLPEAIAV